MFNLNLRKLPSQYGEVSVMMDLKIASLNINGFRSKLKHALIKQFVFQQKLDMLLLQETDFDNMRLARTIEQRLNVVNCIWNFSKGVSCGLAILIFNKDICIENFHSDFFGRVIKLDFSLYGFQNFRVVNAYFQSYYSERLDIINV